MNLNFLKWLMYPAAWLYGLITRLRNLLYDRRIFASVKMPVPVIAVGNITAGGTGKTPFVIALAEFLTGKGFRIAIITRGYHRQTKGQVIVADGQQILATSQQAGDEPYMMAQKLSGVVIIADADRVAAAQTAVDRFACNLIIADDAFQHRRIDRDLDIVLWDRQAAPKDEALLPAGRLRESLCGLKRADFVVFTKSDEIPADQQACLQSVNPHLKFFAAPLAITAVCDRSGRAVAPADLALLNVLAFCGLGNHMQFEATVRQLNLNLVTFRRFSDHHKYTESDLRHLVDEARQMQCPFLITTEKDAVNLPKTVQESDKILILKIELKLDEKLKAAVLENVPPSSDFIA
ncbi:MAG: tetraacyldisaccharide 4'-kinase [Candidatus Neomarinimicrobiota bacterium]